MALKNKIPSFFNSSIQPLSLRAKQREASVPMSNRESNLSRLDHTSCLSAGKSYNHTFIQSLLFLIILLLTQNLTFAEIRYVSKTGSSTPPYTSWETASDSIQKAINISNFGDTIYVANGVYKERVVMIPGLSLIGGGMDSCVIDILNIPSPPFYTVRVTDSCYFKGFHVLSYSSNSGIGIYIYDSNITNIYAIIEHNRVSRARIGIRITSSALGFDNTYKLVKKNIINNVEDGIDCSLTQAQITENIIINPGRYGLVSQINSMPTYMDNIVVLNGVGLGFSLDIGFNSVLRNNLVYGKGGGFRSYKPDTIINNVVYSKDNFGVGYNGSRSIVKNNHFENLGWGLYYSMGGSPPLPIVQYNNMWNNENDYVNYTADSTNISANPMFVKPDSMDFRLQMYSPLIDTGDPSILDVDGTRSDIGVMGGAFGKKYEYLDLPPVPPRNVTAVVDTKTITVKWKPNTEADFNYYILFRDTVADFNISHLNLIAELSDTFYSHKIKAGVSNYYYKLTSVDKQGNESGASEEISVNLTSITEYPHLVNDYILYQNYPNPFNPSTTISYRLKERSYVKLYVYDIKGELVEVLVNENQERGYYEIKFPSFSNNIELSSGIYIYKMLVRNENNIPVFTDIKKMMLVK